MNLTIIAAVDKKGAIGCNNNLLCHLPDELKFFKKTTLNHAVVMGRKTFESIGKPLPNRLNIILSRQENYRQIQDCKVINSIPECINFLNLNENSNKEVFVIGGESIFSQTFSYCEKIILTVIDNVFEEADSYLPSFNILFPEFSEKGMSNNREKWIKKVLIKHAKDEKHPYSYTTYELNKDKRYTKSKASTIEQYSLV